jgi:hypothetical protein
MGPGLGPYNRCCGRFPRPLNRCEAVQLQPAWVDRVMGVKKLRHTLSPSPRGLQAGAFSLVPGPKEKPGSGGLPGQVPGNFQRPGHAHAVHSVSTAIGKQYCRTRKGRARLSVALNRDGPRLFPVGVRVGRGSSPAYKLVHARLALMLEYLSGAVLSLPPDGGASTRCQTLITN